MDRRSRHASAKDGRHHPVPPRKGSRRLGTYVSAPGLRKHWPCDRPRLPDYPSLSSAPPVESNVREEWRRRGWRASLRFQGPPPWLASSKLVASRRPNGSRVQTANDDANIGSISDFLRTRELRHFVIQSKISIFIVRLACSSHFFTSASDLSRPIIRRIYSRTAVKSGIGVKPRVCAAGRNTSS